MQNSAFRVSHPLHTLLDGPYHAAVKLGGVHQIYGSAQLRRRSEIFAKTRRMIGQQTINEITIRSIAKQCDVSVQTLYNSVGKKVNIFEGAICDEILHMARSAQCMDSYPNAILALSDINCYYISEWPEYSKNVLNACIPSKGVLYSKVSKCIDTSLRSLLQEMKIDGTLHESVDIVALAIALNAINLAVSLEWAGGYYDDVAFRDEVARRNSFLLLSNSTTNHAERIEEWLGSIKRPQHLPCSPARHA